MIHIYIYTSEAEDNAQVEEDDKRMPRTYTEVSSRYIMRPCGIIVASIIPFYSVILRLLRKFRIEHAM